MQLNLAEIIGLAFSLITAFVGVMAFFARLLMSAFDKRLDEKFAALERSRAEDKQAWESRYDKQVEAIRHVERDVSKIKEDLPKNYWQREDAIRETAVIHAKVDSLAAKIEALIMQLVKGEK